MLICLFDCDHDVPVHLYDGDRTWSEVDGLTDHNIDSQDYCVHNAIHLPVTGFGPHRWARFWYTHHTTTLQPNATRISKNTLHIVKFIKIISFECETQSLIAVLTLYTGFHAFSTTTLTSFPPAKETI
jgi:hypothetical protein